MAAVEPLAKEARISVVTGDDSPVCRDKTALISVFTEKLSALIMREDQGDLPGL